MVEEKIIILQSFDNPVEANIVRAKLESFEIPCFLTDEHFTGLNPNFNPMTGGVKLRVFEKDVERALAILQEENFILVEDESDIVCPTCNSADVTYGKKRGSRFIITALLISVVFMIYPFRGLKTYRCNQCGNEFK